MRIPSRPLVAAPAMIVLEMPDHGLDGGVAKVTGRADYALALIQPARRELAAVLG
jgi:hypothetical protein